MKTKKWRIDTPISDVKTVKNDEDQDIVVIKGYASTFEEDRDGDIVDKSAFANTKDNFMKNPVVLTDHENRVQHVVGKVISMSVDRKGLGVEVQMSNSSDEYTSMVRTKVKEGLLRAFSIGGMFGYEGAQVKEIDLLEISIVPIPANQSSLFSVAKKSLELDVEKQEDKQEQQQQEEREDQEQAEDTEQSTEKEEEKQKDFESLSDIRTDFIQRFVNIQRGDVEDA